MMGEYMANVSPTLMMSTFPLLFDLGAPKPTVRDIADTVKRLGVTPTGDAVACVLKTVHTAHGGKMSITRVLVGQAGDNSTFITADGEAGRVSGVSKSANGYMTRLDYGCVNPGSSSIYQGGTLPGCKLGTEGGQNLHAARVALRWIPNDRIENNLIATGSTAVRARLAALPPPKASR